MGIDDWFLTAAERDNPAFLLPPWSAGNRVVAHVHGSAYFARLVEEVRALRPGDHLGTARPGSASVISAARLLAVRESWLRRRATARLVPCTFLGKHLRFSHADVVAIATAGACPTDAAVRARRARARRATPGPVGGDRRMRPGSSASGGNERSYPVRRSARGRCGFVVAASGVRKGR